MNTRVSAWHNNRIHEHSEKYKEHAKNGWRLVSLSLHGTSADQRITAVMLLGATSGPTQHHYPLLTETELKVVLAKEKQLGFYAVILAATGTANEPRYAAVFEATEGLPDVYHKMPLGDANTPTSYLGRGAEAHKRGLIPRWISAYGTAETPLFAGIWVPNTNRVVWNAEGVKDTVAQYQERFDAYVSWSCRASLVSLVDPKHYASVFVHTDVGRLISRHNMTGQEYQVAFDKQVAEEGLIPICVQAAGSGSGTRYAALFVQHDPPLTERFRSEGPTAHPLLDDLIERFMRESPIWRVGVAVVHGKKLVYTRGYSYGEPRWPEATPRTAFRLGSVSKVFTAVAVYRAMERLGPSIISLDTKVQNILKLKMPDGKPPKDSRFGSITIRHLLEHTSGLVPDAHRHDEQILKAHRKASPGGDTLHLPVTPKMFDSYVASLDLTAAPGTTKQYNNCGYCLLGRVIAVLYGKPTVDQAYTQEIFAPLVMGNTRAAQPLMRDQRPDDARCRGSLDESAKALALVTSIMDEARAKVPHAYGNYALQRFEGSGGLVSAPIDLARLMIVWTSGTDTPVLKASSAAAIMANGRANVEAWKQGNPNGQMTSDNRAGHGFDRVEARSGGLWMGFKGGSLGNAGCWFTIDGEWGLVVTLAGNPKSELLQNEVGAAQLTLLPKVKEAFHGAPDLFPKFFA